MAERKPYIEITGVTKAKEAQAIADSFQHNILPNFSHRGAVGYLASYKSLESDNVLSPAYLSLKDMAGLLKITAGSGANIIHYRTHDRLTLGDQITNLFEYPGIYDYCKTIQFNMHWPDPNQIEQAKKDIPELEVVVALTPTILKKMGRIDMVNRLVNYKGIADYLLIDPSGGRGQVFDSREIPPIYRAIKHYFPETPVILAGGFDDQNVTPRLTDLFGLLGTKDFGVDAFARLRDGREIGSLSIPKTISYIKYSAASFASSLGS